MNHSDNPIYFQNSSLFSWPFPAFECESQLPPHTIPPAFYMVSNNQSSYAGDRLNLPASAVASSEREAGEKIKATAEKRRKVVRWTEEEHRNFLRGLKLYGRGRWKTIAKEAVKTKSPSQVASHAQKYLLRQEQGSENRKRVSIHDITEDDVASVPQQQHQRLPAPYPIVPQTICSQQQPQHPVLPPAQTTWPASRADLVPDWTADPLSQQLNLDSFDQLPDLFLDWDSFSQCV